ncbi:MAG: hypothetical protein NT096_01125 [Proteobacteria bacterium]|nr:hypothetical protein [Pseudomonadota bacterium]
MKTRIMRYLWVSFPIGIFIIGFFVLDQITTFLPRVEAGVEAIGTISTRSPSGENYVFAITNLVFPKGGGFFTDALMEGTGQFLYQKGKDRLLLTAHKIVSLNANKLVLKINDKRWECQINRKTFWDKLGLAFQKDSKVSDETLFCDGTKKTEWSNLKPGDMVIVVSHIENIHTASTVRKGFLLVKTGHSFTEAPNEKSYTPVDYECSGR